jgi:hypothetical protein
LRRYGVPVAFYGDRSGVFTRNDDHWSLGATFIAAQTKDGFCLSLASQEKLAKVSCIA